MIPEIKFTPDLLNEKYFMVKINEYSSPILINIKIESCVPFVVVSAKLKSVLGRFRIYIAEISQFGQDDVYWWAFGREFTLSSKNENKKIHEWRIAMSTQIIKQGNNQIELKLETEII